MRVTARAETFKRTGPIAGRVVRHVQRESCAGPVNVHCPVKLVWMRATVPAGTSKRTVPIAGAVTRCVPTVRSVAKVLAQSRAAQD